MSNENTQTNTATETNAAPEKMIQIKSMGDIFGIEGLSKDGFLIDNYMLAYMADDKEACHRVAHQTAQWLYEVFRGNDIEIPEKGSWLFLRSYEKMKKRVETFLKRQENAEKARAKKCNN